MNHSDWSKVTFGVNVPDKTPLVMPMPKTDFWMDIRIDFDDIEDDFRSYDLIAVTGEMLPYELIGSLLYQFPVDDNVRMDDSMESILSALDVNNVYRLWIRAYWIGDDFHFEQIGYQTFDD